MMKRLHQMFVIYMVLKLSCFNMGLSSSALAKSSLANPYKFGDIIAFQHLSKKSEMLLFTHFAVFVGEQQELQTINREKKNIFHVNGTQTNGKNCVFANMDDFLLEIHDDIIVETSQANFLDSEGFELRTTKDMVKEIEQLHTNCNGYNLFKHICNLMPLHVRYNDSKMQKTEEDGDCVIKKK